MKCLSWNLIEKSILNEINFLKGNLLFSPYNQNNPINCNDCILRNIAILIVSGRIKIKKINYSKNSIWLSDDKYEINLNKNHGARWHDSLMIKIANYFEDKNFTITDEPALFYGRADLGIKELKLFIEIGTVDLFKLYMNILNVTDHKIIIVPSDDYLLEIYYDYKRITK